MLLKSIKKCQRNEVILCEKVFRFPFVSFSFEIRFFLSSFATVFLRLVFRSDKTEQFKM